jgi:hypothetical protein
MMRVGTARNRAPLPTLRRFALALTLARGLAARQRQNLRQFNSFCSLRAGRTRPGARVTPHQ